MGDWAFWSIITSSCNTRHQHCFDNIDLVGRGPLPRYTTFTSSPVYIASHFSRASLAGTHHFSVPSVSVHYPPTNGMIVVANQSWCLGRTHYHSSFLVSKQLLRKISVQWCRDGVWHNSSPPQRILHHLSNWLCTHFQTNSTQNHSA